ncbi:MAG TPA: MarR family transcriptional regulator [Gemmatimonadaceae bacterium]|nr:MarR family transcriptional regulator [Gemmatimonadaceae bacterium]
MHPDLRADIRQSKPFSSLEQEAFLNVLRTEAELSDSFERVLRPFGISGAQYNVLRILRGSDAGGLCRNEIRDRLLTRMPDVTRLLDRMEDAGLITRSRSAEDRRQVTTQLTRRGRELVDELDSAVADEHRRRLGHLDHEQLRALVELLTLARQGG